MGSSDSGAGSEIGGKCPRESKGSGCECLVCNAYRIRQPLDMVILMYLYIIPLNIMSSILVKKLCQIHREL